MSGQGSPQSGGHEGDDAFTVYISDNRTSLEGVLAKLSARVRKFVEGIVGSRVRTLDLPAKGLNRLSLRDEILKQIALATHFLPSERRTLVECAKWALETHGRTVEEFIDDNGDLLCEVKFGLETRGTRGR